MTISTILTIIGLCLTLFFSGFALYFSTKSSKRTDTKDIEQRVADNTKINMKLDNICASTQEIKEQISSVVKDVKDHNNRLIIVEQQTHALHERVDSIESRVGKEDRHHE